MDGGEVASTIIGGLGLLGGVIGFVFARLASRKADRADKRASKARAEATRAAQSAANALARAASASEASAAALLRANEIAEKMLPTEKPVWNARNVGGSKWVIYNESPGLGIARAALVAGGGSTPQLIIPEESEPRDVGPGDGLAFLARRALGHGSPVVRLSWEVDGERIQVDRTLH